MNLDRVDTVMTFALCIAAERDEWDRELGPIHLIKYVYLADLAHMEDQGTSFTGVDWKFFHFGPWAPEVQQRVEPLMLTLGATERTFEGAEGTGTRFRLTDAAERLEEVRRELPAMTALKLRRWVNEFGSDTPGLLHFVYRTPPMLAARPRQPLNLAAPVPALERTETYAAARPADTTKGTSKKAQRRRKQALAQAAESIRGRLVARVQERRAETRNEQPAPRYDDVHAEGVAWLDELAGAEVEETAAAREVEFDPELWEEDHDGQLP